MTGDFNIKDNGWDSLYSYHSAYANTFSKIADSIDLELSILINQVSTYYANNPNKANSIIDLIFLWANSKEFNNYFILPDLQSLSDHAPLTVDKIGNINTTDISNSKLLERVVQKFASISDNLQNKHSKCIKITECSKA